MLVTLVSQYLYDLRLIPDLYAKIIGFNSEVPALLECWLCSLGFLTTVRYCLVIVDILSLRF